MYSKTRLNSPERKTKSVPVSVLKQMYTLAEEIYYTLDSSPDDDSIAAQDAAAGLLNTLANYL